MGATRKYEILISWQYPYQLGTNMSVETNCYKEIDEEINDSNRSVYIKQWQKEFESSRPDAINVKVSLVDRYSGYSWNGMR